MTVNLAINGDASAYEGDPRTSLLDVLRKGCLWRRFLRRLHCSRQWQTHHGLSATDRGS